MKNNTASAAGAAMPKCHKTRRDLPPFESENYLTVFILCHHRMTALYRIAEGRERSDDRSMVTGCDRFLAVDGWTPKDFGFVDPPMFELKANVGTVFAALDAPSVN
jgi:hypothetical protein